MTTYIKKKIVIEGMEYWYIPSYSGSPFGPISPLEHCDEEGELVFPAAFNSPSFGHVMCNGDINRFGTVIGNIHDFIND